MGTVIMHNVVSVHGFIADAKDQVGPLFDWYANGEVETVEGGGIKVSQVSAGYVRPMWASIGSMVIGRHQHLLEDPHTVIRGDRVLHLRYRVRR
jgi:hypothetical protein